MKSYKICLIEGDGIGHEVIPAARLVLEATGVRLEFVEAQAGWETFERTGISVPEATLEAIKHTDATLFGAATSPTRKVPGFFGAIRYLRRKLDLFANVRPAKHHPVPGSRPGVDLVVVRENTEGLYVEQERSYLDGEIAIADTVITRRASARIGEYAARLAAARPRKQLHIAHKANVLPVTQGLFMNTVLAEAARFPELKTQDIIIDNCAMQLVRNPERFDVIVTTNLFGDILSDLTAGLVGGLGIAASGNIGKEHAVFEPVHGSAPDIAGKGIANPTAAILSAAMMLEYLGESAAAQRIEAAVDRVLAEGPRTPDLGGSATTLEFAQAVAKAL
ncbi:MAG: isocitrate/isopropylmalate dehydrogenase family protein [Meiothermus sp.]|uniref:isocitrate/isopropylmalate dehydrogenase family protein n=1 Tax=Meiothermus sp. TaxID=1955249 RepID=UPI0025EC7831|nr:isocitrate/isopropylmalate dehydrogenase family protein [Meiothermus sp.]MCS7057924.1 isocitrate/isopropylmalate dehydrogenase family protein [Meiothermus sp.]MCS7194200.1 isocitrate/isopropylmalate dehydrogenase family protein [Meiothermus sp.]MCX7741169.1 isocitrate/isopropylmalate dehydrogenase family protein [Meiothermus sp.]MDW8090061.1 isocitrate/isopropylmalate dehydrogenase family protein [Meiothermus sp.]MDW8480709.1 isocitrate/isopropylmalate dehydrogenase family protein [Meiother